MDAFFFINKLIKKNEYTTTEASNTSQSQKRNKALKINILRRFQKCPDDTCLASQERASGIAPDMLYVLGGKCSHKEPGYASVPPFLQRNFEHLAFRDELAIGS
jgi:hypothetical protein